MELLSDVRTPEDFMKNLGLDRHLTSGVGEWIAEYRRYKKSISMSKSDPAG
jgi:hypothetical protein